MKKKENSNIMIKILSKILIIIIALFILLVISVGLNIYFVYELSTYETTITVTHNHCVTRNNRMDYEDSLLTLLSVDRLSRKPIGL